MLDGIQTLEWKIYRASNGDKIIDIEAPDKKTAKDILHEKGLQDYKIIFIVKLHNK